MRSNVDNAILRGTVQESALLFKSEVLAISAATTIGLGAPPVVAYDPAATSRNITLYTPSTTSLWHKHELFNISTGAGILNLLQPDGATAIGSVAGGQRAEIFWNPKSALWEAYIQTKAGVNTVGAQMTLSLYTTLAGLVNTQVLAAAVPFAFKLNSVGFRVRTPATTAAKLATLTGQIQGTPVTGGIISLTSANATPTNTLVAGTTITALNVGAAGNSVGVAVSAVTAFIEGDGYVEFNVTNTNDNI